MIRTVCTTWMEGIIIRGGKASNDDGAEMRESQGMRPTSEDKRRHAEREEEGGGNDEEEQRGRSKAFWADGVGHVLDVRVDPRAAIAVALKGGGTVRTGDRSAVGRMVHADGERGHPLALICPSLCDHAHDSDYDHDHAATAFVSAAIIVVVVVVVVIN